jgi:hypothetical protein
MTKHAKLTNPYAANQHVIGVAVQSNKVYLPPLSDDHLPTHESEPQALRTRHANGSHFSIALACWLFSSIGVLMSLMLIASSSVVSLIRDPLSYVLQSGTFYLGLSMAFAWTALAVMTVAWVSNQQISRLWPLLGGLTGILCSAVFAAFIPLYLPCLFLGLYLCYFHLAGSTASEQNAA